MARSRRKMDEELIKHFRKLGYSVRDIAWYTGLDDAAVQRVVNKGMSKEELKYKIARLFHDKGALDFVEIADELGEDDIGLILEILNELYAAGSIRPAKDKIKRKLVNKTGRKITI